MLPRCQRRHAAYAATLVVVLAFAGSVRAQSLLTNGSFESGTVGFATSYAYSPGNLLETQTFDLVADPFNSSQYATSFHDHTTGAGRMFALNGAVTADVTVWAETVPVTPGGTYRFSFWEANWYPSNPPALAVLFNGTPAGTFNAPLGAGVWRQATFTWPAGAATSATIRIVNTNTEQSGNDFALDDLSFTAVPEPSSLGLAGLAATGVFAHWHRRRQRSAHQ